jgi:hypothetical protein
LEQNLPNLRAKGLGVVAISYDSQAVLRNFADRKAITFPLLSDPESKIIRAFNILNESVQQGSTQFGIPYPGTYILDTKGIVTAKFFENDFRERTAASDILAREFGIQPASAGGGADAKHVHLTYAASTATARPGQRIALSLDLDLGPNMHVYAPGVSGYIPIDWKIDEGPAAKLQPFSYPASETLRLEVIKETVPVYRKHVSITREVTFGQENALRPLLTPEGDLVLRGSFRYQACNDKECFIPETVPLEWRFHFSGLERERVPAELQRKK